MKPELVEPDYKRWDPGDVIGRYTLLTRIAIGGMAEIWLARQKGLEGFEKVVVIKRIADAYSSDATFVEMFLDEARIAAQLDHPNIVQIHDLGEHRGAYYIAMEYLHGEDLAMTVRSGAKGGERLPYHLAAQIISHAAEGLASAHQKVGLDGKPLSIVHRDVSPQNIFVTYEGVVKVLDFGVAKAANRASHTQGGQVKGKFGYMAPEQARGDDLDGRADVWSLGVVLFEAVTVSRLWDPKAETNRMLRELMMGETPMPLARTRNPDVPAELEEIIAKALARDPRHRYQSANELRAALDRWMHGGGGSSATVDLSAYMRRVFAERIGRKSALIESARSGEIKFFKVPEALKPDTENSMPGVTVLVPDEKKGPRGRPPLAVMAALGVVAAALVIGGIWLLSARPPAPPILEVDTEPPGARIEIDGVDVGVAPFRSTTLPPGKHVVLAMVEGRQEQAKTVTLTDATLTTVALRFPDPVVAAAEPEPAPEPAPVAEEPARAAAAPAPERAVASRGKLSVDTNPWSHVYLDGRKLGDTPLINHPVPAGKHKLKLVNDEKGLTKVVDVTIQPGKTTVQKLQLK